MIRRPRRTAARRVSATIHLDDADQTPLVAECLIHPGSPATRTDPADPGSVEIESAVVDGFDYALWRLSDKQVRAIEEEAAAVAVREDAA